MRISDWSSDVCSSDLIARGGDEMRHRGDILIMRESGVERGGRLDQMLDDLTLVGGAKLALPEREVRGERGEHRELAGEGLRSEEHTSELQSLMRISYAVFCLKKKKIKSIKDIRTTIQ